MTTTRTITSHGQTLTSEVHSYIAKCNCGHTVRGERFMGTLVAITEGASVKNHCWFMCACGGYGMPKGMDIKVSTTRKCDARCTGATGPVCSCNCDGHNHGTDLAYAG